MPLRDACCVPDSANVRPHQGETVKTIATAVLLIAFSSALQAQVFRCDEPKGISMRSSEGHKPGADGYKGVKPVVIIGEKEMTIVWGDSQSAGGEEKVWKAVIINRNPRSVGAVTLDVGEAGSTVMLYTMDLKRSFLYMSAHKEGGMLNDSNASTFVSRCGK